MRDRESDVKYLGVTICLLCMAALIVAVIVLGTLVA